MSEKVRDRDIKMLDVACKYLDSMPLRMRRANLVYLWDKYIVNPPAYIKTRDALRVRRDSK